MAPFYFPEGKPIPAQSVKEYNESLDKIFGPSSAKKAIPCADFEEVIKDVFKMPKIFNDMLFTRIEKVLEKVSNNGIVKQ